MIDPALYSGVLNSLELAIQHTLRYDPGTQRQIAQWNGKHICIQSHSPAFTCHLLFCDDQIQLRSHHEEPADCVISGSLSDIGGLLGRDLHSLADTGVHVEGDVALLNSLQTLIKQVEIDWEQALADIVGDDAAHTVAAIIRAQLSWLRQRFTELPQWLPDYLTEELQILPSQNEQQAYFEDIQQLRMDVDRFAARLRKTANNLSRTATDSPPSANHRI